MSMKIDKSFIDSIQFVTRPFKKFVTQVANPWEFFVVYGLRNVLAAFAIMETVQHPASQNNILRETLLNYPGIGPSTQRTVTESQIITNNNTNNVVQDATRERDRFIIVITPIIWVISFYYAFSSSRSKITEKLMNSQNVPKIMSEVFKRTRWSRNGAYRIVTDVLVTSFQLLAIANPSIVNTFYDPNFLSTEGGMQAVVSFFNFLASSEGNYVPMIQPTLQALPPFEAGTVTTFGSLSKASNDFLNVVIYVLQGNAYQNNTAHATHINDANLASVIYVDQSGNPYTNHIDSSHEIEIAGGTLLSHVKYIVDRVTGVLPNPSRERVRPQSAEGQTSTPQQPLGQDALQFVFGLIMLVLSNGKTSSRRNRHAFQRLKSCFKLLKANPQFNLALRYLLADC